MFKLILCFASKGRHRLYKKLLIELDHSGVQGLLVHQIKEEANAAIEVRLSAYHMITKYYTILVMQNCIDFLHA